MTCDFLKLGTKIFFDNFKQIDIFRNAKDLLTLRNKKWAQIKFTKYHNMSPNPTRNTVTVILTLGITNPLSEGQRLR